MAVLINLANTVKGHSMYFPLSINEPKRLRFILGENHFLKWDQNDFVLNTVIVTQLEIAPGENRIPANPVEQFMNRRHLLCPSNIHSHLNEAIV
jgi:hypothetical protein